MLCMAPCYLRDQTPRRLCIECCFPDSLQRRFVLTASAPAGRRGPITVPLWLTRGTVLVSMQNGDQYAPAH
ncbi:alpha-L-rhamnosidase [Streptomyces sp. NBRC 110611]|nr:alpha-L-rhamnosidase [Streptomyces sp. NBRC 110611]